MLNSELEKTNEQLGLTENERDSQKKENKELNKKLIELNK